MGFRTNAGFLTELISRYNRSCSKGFSHTSIPGFYLPSAGLWCMGVRILCGPIFRTLCLCASCSRQGSHPPCGSACYSTLVDRPFLAAVGRERTLGMGNDCADWLPRSRAWHRAVAHHPAGRTQACHQARGRISGPSIRQPVSRRSASIPPRSVSNIDGHDSRNHTTSPTIVLTVCPRLGNLIAPPCCSCIQS